MDGAVLNAADGAVVEIGDEVVVAEGIEAHAERSVETDGGTTAVDETVRAGCADEGVDGVVGRAEDGVVGRDADGVVAGIGDEKRIAEPREPARVGEPRARTKSGIGDAALVLVVAAEASDHQAVGERGERDEFDRVATGVGDPELVGRPDGDGVGLEEAGVRHADGADGERGVGELEDADEVVAGVGDVKVVGAIEREADGIAETGGSTGTVDETGKAGTAGERGDGAVGEVDETDGVVAGIGNDETVDAADGGVKDSLRIVETGEVNRTVVGAKRPGLADERGDGKSGGVEPCDAVVSGIGDVEITVGVGGDTGGFVQRAAGNGVHGDVGGQAGSGEQHGGERDEE